MRVSELSRHSGVPVATIKYYLREGLLPKGEATSATQAVYSETHLRRLRLIRALVEGSGVPLAKVRAILDAIDDTGVDLHHLLGTVQYALTPETTPTDDPEWQDAQQRTEGLLARLDWWVGPFSPARHQLTRAIATVLGLGYEVGPHTLDVYATAARTMADHDVTRIDPAAPREEAVEYVAVITALMDQMVLALHRLAQEDASARRFHDPDAEC
ncbi:DNA-binding transcriptional MerR regulator [Lipingzhangella halophila]|uniref:DNA-binding transcriptional MerR regulator n=1 Tax=Lipingzhangella halophila TaxID=1783352 RepID=A0A7W7W4A5_9ACTN|nr:MerR family transcriptional regulator [Lipingzhangella halophila]MBB4933601.1 DNA-binding transcriptional MerR regulator [Lipingzhangella halophila]